MALSNPCLGPPYSVANVRRRLAKNLDDLLQGVRQHARGTARISHIICPPTPELGEAKLKKQLHLSSPRRRPVSHIIVAAIGYEDIY